MFDPSDLYGTYDPRLFSLVHAQTPRAAPAPEESEETHKEDEKRGNILQNAESGEKREREETGNKKKRPHREHTETTKYADRGVNRQGETARRK